MSGSARASDMCELGIVFVIPGAVAFTAYFFVMCALGKRKPRLGLWLTIPAMVDMAAYALTFIGSSFHDSELKHPNMLFVGVVSALVCSATALAALRIQWRQVRRRFE